MIIVAIDCTLFAGLFAGCATFDNAFHERAVQEQIVREQAVREQEEETEAKPLDYAPSSKEVLLKKAHHYQKSRDYANALINIVRAEKAEGDERLDESISRLKNNLIENLNARALYEGAVVEAGRGADAPLEYMLFYTEGELIYPTFNVPVTFKVHRGEARITEKSFTNSAGIARCDVMHVNRLEGGGLVIRASVRLHIEDDVFNIEKLERDFLLYHCGLREKSISFVVLEQNNDREIENSVSGKRIEQFFIQSDFSVLQGMTETDEALFFSARDGDASSLAVYEKLLGSGLVAFTHIQSLPSSKVSEDFFFAISTISLSMVDLSTGRLVFESVVEDVKGAGSTEEKAGARAIMGATDRFIEQLHVQVPKLH